MIGVVLFYCFFGENLESRYSVVFKGNRNTTKHLTSLVQ